MPKHAVGVECHGALPFVHDVLSCGLVVAGVLNDCVEDLNGRSRVEIQVFVLVIDYSLE